MAVLRRLLCRLGLHCWHLHGGYAIRDGEAVAIFYSRTCERCGVSERKAMGL